MDSRKKKKRFEFFCPLCCSQQRTSTIKKISWQHHLGIAVAAILFVGIFWDIFGAKGFSSYLVFWGFFEVFYRTRKRSEFVCRNCGFDPFLYKSDVNKTRDGVKAFLQNRILAEGHFRGKKLKNYTTSPLDAGAKKATEETPAVLLEKEDKVDKAVIPMPSTRP